jgi:hypothetical protein
MLVIPEAGRQATPGEHLEGKEIDACTLLDLFFRAPLAHFQIG